jgi:hypothetical protein
VAALVGAIAIIATVAASTANPRPSSLSARPVGPAIAAPAKVNVPTGAAAPANAEAPAVIPLKLPHAGRPVDENGKLKVFTVQPKDHVCPNGEPCDDPR